MLKIAQRLYPSGARTRTVALLNDCRDQDNFGAQALVDGLVGVLDVSLPNTKIRPILSHWVIDASTGFGAFVNGGKGMQQPRAEFPHLADQFEEFAAEWLGRPNQGEKAFIEKLRGADLVILNGEGSIYRTNLSAQRELFLAWFAKTQLRVPTVFLNGMIHLTTVMPILPAMVRKTFAALDAVAVREPCSWRNLREFMPDLPARVFPDSAFWLTPAAAETSPAVREIRAKIAGQPYFCFDPGSMLTDHRTPYKSALYELIRQMQTVVPTAVLVSSAPADNYIENIARETNSIYVNSLTRYAEFMALVGDAQFLISGRYHNPILAAIMGCPTLTLASTSHKVHGACETLGGLIGSPYDGTDLRVQLPAMLEQAQMYGAQRAELRTRLTAKSDELRQEVNGLGKLAAQVLENASSAPHNNGFS